MALCTAYSCVGACRRAVAVVALREAMEAPRVELTRAIPACIRPGDDDPVHKPDTSIHDDTREGGKHRAIPLPAIHGASQRHLLVSVEHDEDVRTARAIVITAWAVSAKLTKVVDASRTDDVDTLSSEWCSRSLERCGQSLEQLPIKRHAPAAYDALKGESALAFLTIYVRDARYCSMLRRRGVIQGATHCDGPIVSMRGDGCVVASDQGKAINAYTRCATYSAQVAHWRWRG